MDSKIPALNAQKERALRALSKGPRNKSRLAVETYGDDNASTRSMISRLSKQFIDAGLALETRTGRERVMEITARGRERLKVTNLAQSGKQEPVPVIPSLEDALLSLDNPGHRPLHPRDRPRFHLRHGALLVLRHLRNTGINNGGDDHYDSMLRTLIHDEGGNADADGKQAEHKDSKVFASLASTWPGNDKRKRLVGCLVEFQDATRRRETGPEFVLLADRIEPGPDAVLWASGAIDLAHHYSFAAASQIDRMTARRLLSRAKELLEDTAREDPSLRVAAQYRLGKIAKVALAGWSWTPEEPAGNNRLSLASTAGTQIEQVDVSLHNLDEAVVRAGQFNAHLETFERALRNYIARWIILALPSSEWVFRRAGGSGIAAEIEEWAVDMRSRGVLNDLLVAHVKDQENAPLRNTLKEFLKVGESYLKAGTGMQVEPYMAQAQALLGLPVTVALDAEVFEPKGGGYYERMLMNNLWIPEMVASHTIAAAAKGVA